MNVTTLGHCRLFGIDVQGVGLGEDYKALVRKRKVKARTRRYGTMVTSAARAQRAQVAADARWHGGLTTDAIASTVEEEGE